jgi:hypothetical protein
MVKGHKNLLMEIFTLAAILMVNLRLMDNIIGWMEVFLKETSKMD